MKCDLSELDENHHIYGKATRLGYGIISHLTGRRILSLIQGQSHMVCGSLMAAMAAIVAGHAWPK